MNKSEFSICNFVKVEDFLEHNNAPSCLLEELAEFAPYFKDFNWSRKATYESYSNGAYIGSIYNGKRDGIGMYVFDNGDTYIGEWKDDNRSGVGFYYYDSYPLQIYFGEWENGKKNGKGHVWSPKFESEGIYSNGVEVENIYSNPPKGGTSGNKEKGCLYYIIIAVVIIALFNIIF